METKVLTQEEINSLKAVKDKRSKLTESYGIVELRIQEFQLQKEFLKDELKNLHKEEIELGESLQQKYGDGTIDLDKGEFTSN